MYLFQRISYFFFLLHIIKTSDIIIQAFINILFSIKAKVLSIYSVLPIDIIHNSIAFDKYTLLHKGQIFQKLMTIH